MVAIRPRLFRRLTFLVATIGIVGSGLAPAGDMSDVLPIKSKWVGKLTQSGKHPDIPHPPPKFDVVLTVTRVDGNEFDAELHERAGAISFTYMIIDMGKFLNSNNPAVTFKSVASKDVFGIPVTQVLFVGTITDGVFRGSWAYPENEKGITLYGEFEFKRKRFGPSSLFSSGAR